MDPTSDDISAANPTGFQDLPPAYFNISLSEVTNRTKIAASLCSYVEDVCDLENSLGKTLTKAGHHSFPLSRSEWILEHTTTWETLYNVATLSQAKAHTKFAQNVSQGISKVLPDDNKANKKRLQTMQTRMSGLFNELRKARKFHAKNVSKYHSLVQDCEGTIRAKNNDMGAANNSSSTGGGGGGGGEEGSTSTSDACSAVKVADSSSSNISSSSNVNPAAVNMMNRSITKMFTKKSDKPPHERCKDLLKEIDVTEKDLMANSRRLNICRVDLLQEVHKATTELTEIEHKRLSMSKEFVTHFASCESQLSQEQSEMSKSVLSRIAKLSSPKEAAANMFKECMSNDGSKGGRSRSSSFSSKDGDGKRGVTASGTSTVGGGGATEGSGSGIGAGALSSFKAVVGAATAASASGNGSVGDAPPAELMHGGVLDVSMLSEALDKMADSFGDLKVLSQRAASYLVETAECERGYTRGAQKLLEKHGYARNQSTSSTSAVVRTSCASTSSTAASTHPNLHLFAETLFAIESPSSQSTWEYTVKLLGTLSDLHWRLAEVFTDEASDKLDGIAKRMDAAKKDFVEKSQAMNKTLNATFTSAQQLRIKASKLQALLKERKSTVKDAKNEIAGGAGAGSGGKSTAVTSSAAHLEVLSDGERDSLDVSEEKAAASSAASASAAVGAGDAASQDTPSTTTTTTRRSSVKMMQDLGSAIKHRRFKLAVGLETPETRITRIEQQIVTLKEEEEELLESIQLADASCIHVAEEYRNDANNAMKLAQALVEENLELMRGSMQRVSTMMLENATKAGEAVSMLESLCREFDVNTDVLHAVHVARRVGQQQLQPPNGPAALSAGTTGDTYNETDTTTENNGVECSVDGDVNDASGSTSFHAAAGSGVSMPSAGQPVPTTVSGDAFNLLADIPEEDVFVVMHSELIIAEKERLRQKVQELQLQQQQQQPSTNSGVDVSSSSCATAETLLGVQQTTTSPPAVSGVNKKQAPPVDSTLEHSIVAHEITIAGAPATPPRAKPTNKTKLHDDEAVNIVDDDAAATASSPPRSASSSSASSSSSSANNEVPADTHDGKVLSMSSPNSHSDSVTGRDIIADVNAATSSSSSVATTPPGAIEAAHSFAAKADALHNSSSSSSQGARSPAEDGAAQHEQQSASKSITVAATPSKGGLLTAMERAAGTHTANGEELTKFGVCGAPNGTDKVLESFSCALYPKTGLLTHGRLFITQHYLAFSGWPETRVLLPLHVLTKVEKTQTIIYMPAIIVSTVEYGDFFFASFSDRDQCYNLVNNLYEVSKRLFEIGALDEEITRPLEFGYQTKNKLFGGSKNSKIDSSKTTTVTAAATTGAGDTTSGGGVIENHHTGGAGTIMQSPSQLSISSTSAHDDSGSPRTAAATPMPVSTAASPAPRTGGDGHAPPSTTTTTSNGNGDEDKRSVRKRRVSLPRFSAESSSGGKGASSSSGGVKVSTDPALVDLTSLFAAGGITSLKEDTMTEVSAMELWQSFWLYGSGYREFLVSEGDLDVSVGDWMPCTEQASSASNGSKTDSTIRVQHETCPEDVCPSKLPFSYRRKVNYAHPRTSMLMFGPPNATAVQEQYLYIPVCNDANMAQLLKYHQDNPSTGESVSVEHNSNSLQRTMLGLLNPSRFLVMSVTVFDGIPMADVFKVLQYWSVDTSPNNPSSAVVRVGLQLHYCKYSMLKSKIFSGTQEELMDFVAHWFTFAEHRAQAFKRAVASQQLGDSMDGNEGSMGGMNEESAASVARRLSGAMMTGLDIADTPLGIGSRRPSLQQVQAAQQQAAQAAVASNTAAVRQAVAAAAADRQILGIPLRWIVMALLVLTIAHMLSNYFGGGSSALSTADTIGSSSTQELHRRISELEALVAANARETQELLRQQTELLTKALNKVK